MKSQHGFTLIELSFVLIIFGMVTAIVMSAFSFYSHQKNFDRTNDSLDNSNSAILEYVANFGVYPCPADPTLGPGDLNYGVERRSGGLPITDPNYDRQACLTGLPSVPGKDSSDPISPLPNPLNDPTGTTPDRVLIGSVPFKTIMDRLRAGGVMYAKFSEFDTVDGWNDKLTYAVTLNLTNLDTYNSFYGAIDVVDENDQSLVSENEDANNNGLLDVGEDLNGNGVLDFGQYPHFVLVSHGEDARGAYKHNGTLAAPCVLGVIIPPGPLPVGTSAVNEVENCDRLNGKFLSGLRNEKDDSYNDDKTKFSYYNNSALWKYVGQGRVQNTNPGNVGMGTPTPQEKLHVLSDVNAIKTWANRYTDRNGQNKMPADALGGDASTVTSKAMQCDAGKVVTKIENGVVTCAQPFGSTPPTNLLCPVVAGTQYVMYGMKNVGNSTQLLCCDPTAASGSTACP